MKYLSALVLSLFITGCATTQAPSSRTTAQAKLYHFSAEGFSLIDLTDIVIMHNNTRANDLMAQVGVVKEVDEWLYKMLEKETGADNLVSRIFYAPAKDGSETYVVITQVMTNFNLNVIKSVKKGKKAVLSTTVYEILSANQQFLEIVKNAQENPEGYTVNNGTGKLFPF